MTIEELRKMQVEAVQYLVGSGAMHEDDCPCDDTCSCEWKQRNDAINSLVVLHLPLLAVAEAAEKKATECERCGGSAEVPDHDNPYTTTRGCPQCLALRTALADFAKAREAM